MADYNYSHFSLVSVFCTYYRELRTTECTYYREMTVVSQLQSRWTEFRMVAIVLDGFVCQLTPQQKRETVSVSDKVGCRLVPHMHAVPVVAQWLDFLTSIRKTLIRISARLHCVFSSDPAVSFSIFVREHWENLTRILVWHLWEMVWSRACRR